jgi:hypothetical protein
MAKAKEKDQEPDTRIRMKVKGHECSIDPFKLEAKDIIALEEYFDKPFPAIVGEGWLASTKGGAFLTFLAYREQVEPRVSFEDILNLKGEEIEILEADPERPTGTPETSGKKGSGKSSASSPGTSNDSGLES